MKKVFLFALLIFIFNSCRKDDEELEPTVVGNWNYSELRILSGKDNSIISSEAIVECLDKLNFQLRDNNIFTNTYFRDNFIGSCVINGTSEGTYTYDKSNMVITFNYYFNNQTIKYPVHSITDNELQLIETYRYHYDADNDGINDNFIMVFKK